MAHISTCTCRYLKYSPLNLVVTYIYYIPVYRHKASIYLNFLIIFLKNIVTLNNLEIKIRYNCCDFSLNSPQLIPFT